jgi:hypothetical protein
VKIRNCNPYRVAISIKWNLENSLTYIHALQTLCRLYFLTDALSSTPFFAPIGKQFLLPEGQKDLAEIIYSR